MRRRFTHIAILMAMLLSSLSAMASGNDYLEKFEHYQVMSMGDGVLRFNIPVWVWGNTAQHDYYLKCSNGAD